MRSVLDSLLFGFVGLLGRYSGFWSAAFGLIFTLILALRLRIFRVTNQNEFIFCLWVFSILCTALIGAFLAVTLFFAIFINKNYYFLFFEFVSVAWLPSVLTVLCCVAYKSQSGEH